MPLGVYQVEEYYVHITVADKKEAKKWIANCDDYLDFMIPEPRLERFFDEWVIIIDGFDNERSAEEVADSIYEHCEVV